MDSLWTRAPAAYVTPAEANRDRDPPGEAIN